MATFNYNVLTKDGKSKKGKIEANDKDAAIAQLKSEGNTIVSVTAESILNKDIEIGFLEKKVKPRDLSVFCRQFKSIIEAGVSIVAALEMLAEQTENKKLKAAILDVRNNVEKGETLANSMKRNSEVFPSILVNMVEAGEVSGNLEHALDRMALQFEKDSKLKGMIKKALMYPMVLLAVTIGVLVLMCVVIIPNFVTSFEELGTELPIFTVMVLNFSNFVSSKWYIILAVVLLIIVGYRVYSGTDDGARLLASIKLKIPVFGVLVQKTACARFARTLSTLLAAGVSLVEAIETTANAVDNVLYKDELENAALQVQRGMLLSTILKKNNYFPPMILHMLGIGEETGNMEEMLTNAANYYDEEVEATTSQVMALMEPMIIIVMALMVVVLIAAVYGPVMTMTNSIG